MPNNQTSGWVDKTADLLLGSVRIGRYGISPDDTSWVPLSRKELVYILEYNISTLPTIDPVDNINITAKEAIRLMVSTKDITEFEQKLTECIRLSASNKSMGVSVPVPPSVWSHRDIIMKKLSSKGFSVIVSELYRTISIQWL